MEFLEHNTLKKTIASNILTAIEKLYPEAQVQLKDIYGLITTPPNPAAGDLCFGAFILAKDLKKAPPMIAAALCENISTDNLINEVSNAGPYVNFKIDIAKFYTQLNSEIASNEFFEKKLIETSEKTMIEFSQPNTHKELHVGHMRNLCLGDALIKIHRYCGLETLSTTFPGDVGTHVAKCLWYLKFHNKAQAPENRKGAWLGKMYTAANNLLEEQKGTDKEEENRKVLTQILKEIESKQGEYFDLWKETRQWSVELMQEVYKWANVNFDSWYWESDVDSDSVKLIKEYYEKGTFIEDQGAIGINLEDYKLGFCLLLKSDGTGLYATKDIELARRKFEDHKVDHNLYVVDNRQALHFKQVFKTLEIMGFDKSKDCHHIQYEMVELKDGAMSSRKGNIVALQDLIDQMISKIKTDYLAKYKDEWDQNEIDTVANQIAGGAIKYGMNKIDPNKKIVFDMQEWLKLDGDSGPYIQYVCARINSLIGKHQNIECNEISFQTEYEQKLIIALSGFNDVVQNAQKQYKSSLVCSYLYDIAKMFNQFYANCPITGSSDVIAASRVKLSRDTLAVLKQGLALLGIEAPARM